MPCHPTLTHCSWPVHIWESLQTGVARHLCAPPQPGMSCAEEASGLDSLVEVLTYSWSLASSSRRMLGLLALKTTLSRESASCQELQVALAILCSRFPPPEKPVVDYSEKSTQFLEDFGTNKIKFGTYTYTLLQGLAHKRVTFLLLSTILKAKSRPS